MSCRNVQIISKSAVRPASYSDVTQQIDFAPWDLFMLSLHYMQKGLLFTKSDSGKLPKQNEVTTNGCAGGADGAGGGADGAGGGIISHLKTSLSHTLDYFYPLAGRFASVRHEEDDTISFYINCNSAGVEFVHAIADDVSVSDITNSTYLPRIVGSFFSLNGVKNSEGESYPLLSMQVTELIDGIFIGFSANHAACDGTSFWHFVNSWSEISKGLLTSKRITLSRPPVFKRWVRKDTDYPIRLPFSSTNDILSRKQSEHDPSEERGFHFTRENIARLKEKVNSEISDPTYKISSLQALLALVWVAVTRARNLDPNEETKYMLLMGARSRLNPPLPEEYFGNSIGVGFATAKVGELLEKGVGWGSLLLNKVVMSHNDASVRGLLDWFLEDPQLVRFGVTEMSNSMTARSSPRFNMYGNDFGWGQPVAVKTGMSDKYDGTITLSPGAVDGSIDIEVCYPSEILKAMENDVEFMEFVSVTPLVD